MKTIVAKGTKPYEIVVQSGAQHKIGEMIRGLGQNQSYVHIVIVTDNTVNQLYGDTVIENLKDNGYTVSIFSIAPGEQSKTVQTYLSLIDFLSKQQISRTDYIVALGGGVVGDIAGFAAATYLRGMKFVQVPTTLLAQVDSSVGGKTGVDLPQGKNLLGAFYSPELVICDPEFLNTLPMDILKDGYAEVIKYGMIGDQDLLQILLKQDFKCPPDDTILYKCIALKSTIVQQDERDSGIRQILNFGHTIGHAVEACSCYSISHVKAVAMGMMAVTQYAASENICAPECLQILKKLLKNCELPLKANFSSEEIFKSIQMDKKRAGKMISMILPTALGKCEIFNFSLEKVNEIIKIIINLEEKNECIDP